MTAVTMETFSLSLSLSRRRFVDLRHVCDTNMQEKKGFDLEVKSAVLVFLLHQHKNQEEDVGVA